MSAPDEHFFSEYFCDAYACELTTWLRSSCALVHVCIIHITHTHFGSISTRNHTTAATTTRDTHTRPSIVRRRATVSQPPLCAPPRSNACAAKASVLLQSRFDVDAFVTFWTVWASGCACVCVFCVTGRRSRRRGSAISVCVCVWNCERLPVFRRRECESTSGVVYFCWCLIQPNIHIHTYDL